MRIRAQRLPSLFLAVPDPPGDELALRRKGGEISRLAKVGQGFGQAAEFRGERAADGVEKMVGLDRAAICDAVERIDPGLRPVDASDGDSPVHGRDGGGI